MARKEKLKNWAIDRFLNSFKNTPESSISDRLEADKRLDQLCTLAVIRAGLAEWPPWGQPRLPIEATAFNTFLLILSAFAVFKSRKESQQQNNSKALQFHFGAIVLGVCFLIMERIFCVPFILGLVRKKLSVFA